MEPGNHGNFDRSNHAAAAKHDDGLYWGDDATSGARGAGYDPATADAYTKGHDAWYAVEKSTDGATQEMLHEISLLRSEGRPMENIADIGCGSHAEYLREWQQATGARTVMGIEPSSRMRELLSEKADGELKSVLHAVDGDWVRTGLETDSADLVVSRLSLHNVRDIPAAYAELARILRPGAFAVISVPHPDYARADMEASGQVAVEGAPRDVEVFGTTLHYYYHAVETYLGNAVGDNGLELVRSKAFSWGPPDKTRQGIPNTLVFTLKKSVPGTEGTGKN